MKGLANMGIKEDIGIKIRTMRLSRRMTQADLAKAIGQSPSSITMYETGRREPEFEILEAMADVFNVPLVAFVSDDSGLSAADLHLLSVFHSADPKYQALALELLEEHPIK